MAEDELDTLATEGRVAGAATIDLLSTREQVAWFAREDARAVSAVAAAGDAIARAVDLIVDRMAQGGRLIYVGAGTPGRLGRLDAAECGPTFGLDAGRVVAILAGGDEAEVRSVEDSEDDAEAGQRDLLAVDVHAKDVVVGVTASGRTPYVLAALAQAVEAGAATIAVASNPNSPAAGIAHVAVEVLTGPELLSGSTRLKAGTAQKLVLNTLSTLSMVRLGSTYGDLMIDVQATNDKLRRRAHRVVVQATGASDDEVAHTLAAADGQAKTAVVALLADVTVAEARARLEGARGQVRQAVADREGSP